MENKEYEKIIEQLKKCGFEYKIVDDSDSCTWRMNVVFM